jgi:hypothetical protein
MSSGLSGFLEKNQPDFIKKAKPKELGFLDPVSEAGRKRAAGMMEADTPAPTKVGLTPEAQQTQGLTDLSRRRRRKFETVVAGETGTTQTSKLGLTGRV